MQKQESKFAKWDISTPQHQYLKIFHNWKLMFLAMYRYLKVGSYRLTLLKTCVFGKWHGDDRWYFCPEDAMLRRYPLLQASQCTYNMRVLFLFKLFSGYSDLKYIPSWRLVLRKESLSSLPEWAKISWVAATAAQCKILEGFFPFPQDLYRAFTNQGSIPKVMLWKI